MRVVFRKAGIACGTLVASAALAFSSATGALAANTALVIGGISAGSMSDLLMKPLLDYKFDDQKRVNVQWPAEAAPFQGDITLGASIATGITNMTASINTQLAQLQAGEKVTVVGLSAGSLVVNEVLRNLATSSTAPDKSKLTFIVVADSSRQKLIDKARYSARDDYTYQPPPEVEYDVIVVTGEYDGLADRPDRWWNFTALMNSIAGSFLVHVPMMYTTDPQTLIDEANANGGTSKWVWSETNSLGGTTTHVLIPTKKLPLVQMFPSLAAREAELKAKVDAGYSRNDVDNTANRAIASAAPTTATFAADVSDAADTEEATTEEAPKADAPTKTRGENDSTPVADDDVVVDEVVTDDVVTEDEGDSDNGAVEDTDGAQEDADAEAAAEAEAAAAAAAAEAKEADEAAVKEEAAADAAEATDEAPADDAPVKNEGGATE